MKKTVVYLANRLHLVFFLYILSIMLGGWLFAFFEGKTFWDGIWWAVVTALTIGYGDFFPVTVGGRIVGFIFSHLWIWGVIPMIIANIIVRVLENRDSFTHEEQEWQEKTLLSIANKLGAETSAPPTREY